MTEKEAGELYDKLSNPHMYGFHLELMLQRMHMLDNARLEHAILSRDRRLAERAERVLAYRHSKDMRDFTKELHTLALEQDETNKRLDEVNKRQNRWMTLLTILGAVFAAGSLWVGWKALRLQHETETRERAREVREILSTLPPDTASHPPFDAFALPDSASNAGAQSPAFAPISPIPDSKRLPPPPEPQAKKSE